MAVGMNLSGGLQTALSLFQGNRNSLSYARGFGVSNKDLQNNIINRNILSKAAQLVNDLEDARRAESTLQGFLAKRDSAFSASFSQTTITKTTTVLHYQQTRGSYVNIKS